MVVLLLVRRDVYCRDNILAYYSSSSSLAVMNPRTTKQKSPETINATYAIAVIGSISLLGILLISITCDIKINTKPATALIRAEFI